jgi:hypothetical protein
MEFIMSEIDPRLIKAHKELALECKNLILPKGTVLLLHGCPVTIMDDVIINADPKGITFAFNKVEENNSKNLVKIDTTGQLEFIKSLNPGIDF